MEFLLVHNITIIIIIIIIIIYLFIHFCPKFLGHSENYLVTSNCNTPCKV